MITDGRLSHLQKATVFRYPLWAQQRPRQSRSGSTGPENGWPICWSVEEGLRTGSMPEIVGTEDTFWRHCMHRANACVPKFRFATLKGLQRMVMTTNDRSNQARLGILGLSPNEFAKRIWLF